MPTTYLVRRERGAVVYPVGRWSDLEPAFRFFRVEAHALTDGKVVLVDEQTGQVLESIQAGQALTRFA